MSALLGAHGAVVVDADALARAALEPGTAACQATLERFGPAILDGTGAAIDRGKLARVVFADPVALADLEAIVHPVVRAGVEAAVAAHAASDDVVVLDLPLLTGDDGRPRHDVDGVLVVDVPEDVALERLVRARGMDPDDARARIAVQATRSERLRQADFVVTNVGTREELAATVERAWDWIGTLGDEGGGRGR